MKRCEYLLFVVVSPVWWYLLCSLHLDKIHRFSFGVPYVEKQENMVWVTHRFSFGVHITLFDSYGTPMPDLLLLAAKFIEIKHHSTMSGWLLCLSTHVGLIWSASSPVTPSLGRILELMCGRNDDSACILVRVNTSTPMSMLDLAKGTLC